MTKDQQEREFNREFTRTDPEQAEITYTVQVSGGRVWLHRTWKEEWDNADGTGPDTGHDCWVMTIDDLKLLIEAGQWCMEKSRDFELAHPQKLRFHRKHEANIEITHPRYSVQEVTDGFLVVDSTGEEKPHLTKRQEPLLQHPGGIDSSGARAEYWCRIWNIVEMGYCGLCERKIQDNERATRATDFNAMYKRICLECSGSQED